MENSWYLVENDEPDIESLNTSQIGEPSLKQNENISLKTNQKEPNKNEHIKDLNEIEELKINEVLDLITDLNNKRLKNIVTASTEKKSLIHKSATDEPILSFNDKNKPKQSKPDNKINEILTTLSKRQENFISNAKQTDPPKSLAENIKEANKIKHSQTIAAAIDETSYIKNEQPKMSVSELLRANQSDAQLLVSTIKEKNKNYLNAIFDY